MAPETPKGASSRLLSMKFMQRAAASSGTTPGSEGSAPSSKKRKLGHKDDDYDLNINSASIQAAIDERDAKRTSALEQHASNDTHWVLDTKVGNKAGKAEKKRPTKVLYVGYGDFESGDEDEDKTRMGRTSTKKQKKIEESKSGSGSDESDEEDDDKKSARKRKRDSTTPGPRLTRSNSKQTPEADKAKQFRDKRNKKDVNINQPITSISNQGASGLSNSSTMTCFKCQQKGHKSSDCPQKGKSKGKH